VSTRSSGDYLRLIGVRPLPPRTSPFDPGYDPITLEGHLLQSSHLMSILKLSMASWIVAKEEATLRKIGSARRHGVPTVAGGGPFEVATAQGRLPEYLDLCVRVGFTRIECGEGFTELTMEPDAIVKLAAQRGLDVQFELGKKHGGTFTDEGVELLIDQGKRWLDAGALQLVVEARESAAGVDDQGRFRSDLADRMLDAFGHDVVTFEAPTKSSQFALLDHFGPQVHLCNVRLEELLRVEIYRKGLHSDAFGQEKLRPERPAP
jgi:phosphosulfolactate synthase